MKTEFRNRVFLPIVLPVVILLGMVAFIGVFALTLLYSTHEASLMLAAVVAGGILFAISLAATRDRLDAGRRAVLALAMVVPFAVGALYAGGLLGDVPEDARMINVEPAVEVPEDAVLAAENASEFCAYDREANACVEPTDSWEVAAQQDPFVYEFVNLHGGTPHDLTIYELAGDADEPEPGETIHQGDTFPGVDESVEEIDGGLEPGQYYFNCSVHPVMDGVLDVGGEGDDADDADDAEADTDA